MGGQIGVGEELKFSFTAKEKIGLFRFANINS